MREHLDAYMLKKGFDIPKNQKTVKDKDKRTKEEALKTRQGAYLACLFLKMAAKRYAPVKKFLHEGFLAEKQQYPHNVLVMKRFMADFIRANAGKPN